MLSQQKLKTLLHYDPYTGVFTWLIRPSSNANVGDVAGGECDGYVKIQINRVQYPAHRLAWLYVKGVWPVDEIDHRNTIRNDNHWDNLREANSSINRQNQRKAHKRNRSGFLGVTKKGKKFRAQIWVDGKSIALGTYSTPEPAHAAYVDAKRKLHSGCTI